MNSITWTLTDALKCNLVAASLPHLSFLVTIIIRLLLLLFLTLFLFDKAYAGEVEFLQACSNIPGIKECGRPANSSVWVFIENSSAGHNYGSYGSLLCSGGEKNFGFSKGYSITFWDAYNQKQLYKYRCF